MTPVLDPKELARELCRASGLNPDDCTFSSGSTGYPGRAAFECLRRRWEDYLPVAHASIAWHAAWNRRATPAVRDGLVERLRAAAVDVEEVEPALSWHDLAKLLRDAAAALSLRPAETRVKELEWREMVGRRDAVMEFGQYAIEWWGSRGYAVYLNSNLIAEPDTEDKAFAAAQSDFEKRIKASISEPARAEEGKALRAWAEIAEHYRWAMLNAETLINSMPMPVSDGQTSQVWKRVSDAASALHKARQDMIAKHGTQFLNSGPLGPASIAEEGKEPVAWRRDVQFLLDRLSELEITGPRDFVQDWVGHVEPAIARVKDALLSQTGGEAEPVAWQHRIYYEDTKVWSEWRAGRHDKLLKNTWEERPLFPTPPSRPSNEAGE